MFTSSPFSPAEHYKTFYFSKSEGRILFVSVDVLAYLYTKIACSQEGQGTGSQRSGGDNDAEGTYSCQHTVDHRAY